MNVMTAGLPDKVTAQLVHVDSPQGWHVYRLDDRRGYTHRSDTIRVTWGSDRYTVETLRDVGWTPLISGTSVTTRERAHDAAVTAAIAVLYGLEDHG